MRFPNAPHVLLIVSLLGCSSGTAKDPDAGSTADGPDGALAALVMPGCLRDLMAACPTETSCRFSSRNDGAGGVNVCFPGGTRATLTHAPTGTCGAGMSCSVVNRAEVYKEDGSLCYSFERCQEMGACGINRFTWKDPAGVVVAQGRQEDFAQPSIQIECVASTETASCHAPAGQVAPGCCVAALGDTGQEICARVAFESGGCAADTCP